MHPRRLHGLISRPPLRTLETVNADIDMPFETLPEEYHVKAPYRQICMCLCTILLVVGTALAAEKVALRAPSVPLVPVDPYFSIWSPADKLTDAATVHWTGMPNRLTSRMKIDGKEYRLMGNEPKELPALEQTGLSILPTTVTYEFQGAGVKATLSFMTPLLPEDLLVLSRPVTYLTWTVQTTDGKPHEALVNFDAHPEITVNDADREMVTWEAVEFGDIQALKVGSADQPVVQKKGDRMRINWGYLYVAADWGTRNLILAYPDRKIPPTYDVKSNPALAADAPRLGIAFDICRVGTKPVSRHLMLAYDDIYSAQFIHRYMKAYWKKDGAEIGDLLKTSAAEYDDLTKRCAAFDKEFMADLEKAGGPKYAWLGALAYRQSLAASKVIADSNGQPLFFCKENTSNGCMGTVDVFYPQAPLPLLISPSLSRAMLIPVLEYSSSPHWKWPNAPHDMGTWPQANAQVYGGTASDGGMPVEETGNMLLLVAAVVQVDGNADFASKYWPVLTKWAKYLEQKGFDPENQLCTDDFAGHLAHNANLSVKSICALGAYGKLAAMRGDKATGDHYLNMARKFALEWVKVADDGDHFRLAFDQRGTWSSKYNMVWDKILELNLFPEEAVKKEMAFYRKNLDTYGLPLDNRKHKAPGGRTAYWSKTDWAYWTACLTNNQEDFDAITAPIYRFFDKAEQRVGLTDLYFTDRPDTARMHSRPVIGGIFIKMLYDKDVWKKWASRDKTNARGPWAGLPSPPVTKAVVAPGSIQWRYTTREPAKRWTDPDFKDASWKQAYGGFGTRHTPGIHVKTLWNTSDIWIRGEITIPEGRYDDLELSLFHDEDAEVYIDGKLALKVRGFNVDYEPFATPRRMPLKPGKFFFAVHCHQTEGGQGIDLGIVDVKPGK